VGRGAIRLKRYDLKELIKLQR